jgi:hypothetical protein
MSLSVITSNFMFSLCYLGSRVVLQFRLRRMGAILRFVIWVLGVLWIAGCATFEKTQTFKGRFEREPDFWRNGLGYVQSQSQGLTVGYALSEIESDSILFLVTVTNRQKKDILVDSTNFYISDSKSRIQAQHPDFLMAEIDKQIRAKEVQRESAGAEDILDFIDLTVATADVASQLSGRESEKEIAEREERERNRAERERDRSEQASVLRDEISVLQEQKKRIAKKYLRKTTVTVGETLQGFVLFRVPHAAGKWFVSADFLKSHDQNSVQAEDFSVEPNRAQK